MKNWSLNAKISFVLGVMAIGAITISYFGISKMVFINSMMSELSHVDVRLDQLTSDIQDEQRQVSIAVRDMIIERDAEKMGGIEKAYEEHKVKLLKLVTQFSDLSDAEGKTLAAQYHANAEKWFPVLAGIVKLAKKNKDAEVEEIRDRQEGPLLDIANSLVDRMNILTGKRLDEAVAASEAAYREARMLLITISIASILAGAILAYFVMRSLSETISRVIASLNENSTQVTSAARQVASSSEQLSQAATEQATAIEETASAIEEMNSMVLKNSENANRTADISTASHENASKGQHVVQDMIQAIDQINASNQEIASIVKVIGDIDQKTKVINDIVFQTKLLSFNASVEAARAGEHGKGFAVVAEEVGKLAQMSGNAAKEISTLLEGSVQRVETIVNETKHKVESGTKIAQQCGEVLGEIVTNVSDVKRMSGEISVACQEQSQGVQEITKAMSQLDQVTQENASTSEEAASASEELAAQAESLRGMVHLLVETIQGKQAGRTSLPEPESKTTLLQAERGHVLPMKKFTPKTIPAQPEFKKVVGGTGSEVPSEHDSRFNDV